MTDFQKVIEISEGDVKQQTYYQGELKSDCIVCFGCIVLKPIIPENMLFDR